AGMNADPDQPGYKHIIFRPQSVDDMTFVKYFNQTPYGKAGIHWKNEDQQFSLRIIVPVGSEATVYVPMMKEKNVTENGRSIDELEEIEFIKEEDGYQVFKVKSGKYEFLSE
ncbi:MAG: alpha-L-rhamnosidase C-terminal domain-containing protein, partial [Bacteroidota bacterium]|nr:alpha-L-rhamnosidase C-terminal domain-containing protein [Bacteroidota bacterium]